MDKNKLDNISGQEIRELIDDEIVNLQELSDSALQKVLDFETEMLCHGSGDMDMIRRCSEVLDKRSQSNKLCHSEISAIITKARSENVNVVDSGENTPSVTVPKRNRRFVLKRIAIVAAAVIAVMASTVAVAAAFGVDIIEYLGDVVRQPEGTQADIDGYTFYHNGKMKQYSSIEKLLDEEDLDIMYPTKWPEGVSIKDVSVTQTSGGKETVYILTNEMNVSVRVDLSGIYTPDSQTESFQVNGLTCYIQPGNLVSVSFFYNNQVYYIKAKTLDDAILIIENMKE